MLYMLCFCVFLKLCNLFVSLCVFSDVELRSTELNVLSEKKMNECASFCQVNENESVFCILVECYVTVFSMFECEKNVR